MVASHSFATVWTPDMHIVLQGYEAFMDGDYEPALLHYLQSAEMGSELGQSNAAWMLTYGYGYEGEHAAQLAITLYQQAAAQGNYEALLVTATTMAEACQQTGPMQRKYMQKHQSTALLRRLTTWGSCMNMELACHKIYIWPSDTMIRRWRRNQMPLCLCSWLCVVYGSTAGGCQ